MARRLPNRPPPHEPSVVVDPRLYLEALDALDAPPDPRNEPSERPPDLARVSLPRAALLILMSACASYAGVRLLRAQLPSTAHAALVVTPLPPSPTTQEPEPAPLVRELHAPARREVSPVAEPAWLGRVRQARAHFAAGELEAAEALYRAVLIQRAEVPAAQLGLARVRLARGDCGEASTLAASVLTRMPQQRGARAILAACLRVDAASAPDVPARVAAARTLPPNPF